MGLLLSDLIDQIYESAFAPDNWTLVLEKLAFAVKARAAGLIVVGATGSTGFLNSPGYQPVVDTFMQTLNGRFENPRPARHLKRQHHGFLSDLDLSTAAELESDPMYNVVLRPNGIYYSAGTTISLPHGDMLVFDVLRGSEPGPFDDTAIGLLDAHRPHLARAALISARLGLERAQMATQILEALGLPGAAITKTGKALAANSLFNLLSPQVTIHVGDHIRIAAHGPRAAFAEGLKLLGHDSPGKSIPIPANGERSAAVLHLLPLRKSALDVFSGASAFVIVTSLSGMIDIPATVLAGLFDLSPAEANVTRRIIEGMSVAELAKHQKLAPATVRSYLKSIFSKTGVRRQSELVALLSRASLPRQIISDDMVL